MFVPFQSHHYAPLRDVASPASELYNVTLVAPFSVAELQAHLAESFAVLGSQYAVQRSATNSVIRYLFNQEYGLPRRPAGVHILLFRFEDWNNAAGISGCYEGFHPASRLLIEMNLREAIRGLHNAAEIAADAVILVPCPPSAKYQNKAALDYCSDLEEQLRTAAASYAQYFVLLTRCLPEADDTACDDGALYSRAAWRRLSRQLARICYSVESRPWRAIVLGREGAKPTAFLQRFIGRQWQSGRSVALAERSCADPSFAGFAATDDRPIDLASKIRSLADRLLTPVQDLIFLGTAEECSQLKRACPEALSLPVCLGSDFEYLADELWCFDPVMERWIVEREAVRPTIPRLTWQALLTLAKNPDRSVPECCHA